MTTILITGANRGLGLEFARQYAEAGARVLACCREPGRARDLAAIAKVSGGTVSVHRLDVGDPASIAALAKELNGEAIDVLLNNAGVYGDRDRQQLDCVDGTSWEETLRINALGPLLVSKALLANLERGGRKVIALVTSRMGSIADNTSGGAYVYRASKAALNAVGMSLARDLAARGITVVLFHPGWVKTDMGGAGAPIAPKDSIAGMRRLIDKATPKDSGRFLNYDGAAVPW
jgi:NAD(P)-dependent dehydrogenase (short-subunit alcohol dehydrogenase family)